MTGVEVQPADIVKATIEACKVASLGRVSALDHPDNRRVPADLWDLDYADILDRAQEIADDRTRTVRPA